MTKCDEAKIRREGFSITSENARALLEFIDMHNKNHDAIEPEIIVKLELLGGKYRIQEVET